MAQLFVLISILIGFILGQVTPSFEQIFTNKTISAEKFSSDLFDDTDQDPVKEDPDDFSNSNKFINKTKPVQIKHTKTVSSFLNFWRQHSITPSNAIKNLDRPPEYYSFV